MTRRLAVLGVMVLVTGCFTLETWDKGFPRSARQLGTKDERLSEYRKFKVTEITANYVTIDGKHYSRQSFAPVLLHTGRGIGAPLAEGDGDSDVSLALSSALIGTVSFTIPDGYPAFVAVARDGLTFGG